jgi:hypothetical protein
VEKNTVLYLYPFYVIWLSLRVQRMQYSYNNLPWLLSELRSTALKNEKILQRFEWRLLAKPKGLKIEVFSMSFNYFRHQPRQLNYLYITLIMKFKTSKYEILRLCVGLGVMRNFWNARQRRLLQIFAQLSYHITLRLIIICTKYSQNPTLHHNHVFPPSPCVICCNFPLNCYKMEHGQKFIKTDSRSFWYVS